MAIIVAGTRCGICNRELGERQDLEAFQPFVSRCEGSPLRF